MFESFIKSCKGGENVKTLCREMLLQLIGYNRNIEKNINDLKMVVKKVTWKQNIYMI